MKEFLTVKEFAELADKKPQTIYKQLDKRLKPYVKIEKGQTVISSDALKDFYGVEQLFQPDSTEIQLDSTKNQPDSTPIQPDSTVGIQPDSTAEGGEKKHPDNKNEQIETLNKLIEIIQKQLEEKDKQLAVKDKQIADLSERLAEALQLTKGQQYIAAADKTKELIEADKKEPDREIVEAAAVNQEQGQVERQQEKEQPQEKGLRAFFRRLFS